MDDTTSRAAALLAAAIATAGQALPPQALIRYAGQLAPWLTPGPARMTLTIEGDPMPLTIDSANARAVLEFTDRVGDPVPPPDGTQATATSSNPAVLGVGPAAAGAATPGGAPTIEFPLTPAAAGTATLSVHVTAADGTPLLGPDAATPITDAAPVTVTVDPGAAAAERFTVPGAATATAGPAAAGGLGSAQAAGGQPGAVTPPGDTAGQAPAADLAGQAAGQPGQPTSFAATQAQQQPDQPPAGQAPTAEQAAAPPAQHAAAQPGAEDRMTGHVRAQGAQPAQQPPRPEDAPAPEPGASGSA